MIIYSWNMLFRTKKLDEAFAFVANAQSDIFCLQEVPDAFLERLKTLPYHLAEAIDVERLFSPVKRLHLVILSRHPIISYNSFLFPEYWPTLPLRTRLFVRLMRPMHWTTIRNRSGLYANIETKKGPVRVFNLHTALTRPDLRVREFELAMAERDPSVPTIVCGDFNTIESPRISILNWFLGGSLMDVVRYKRERTQIERHCIEHELHNPLRGKSTHAFADSQLDHILVSHSLSVKEAAILRKRYGSDHHPIRVEIS
ncbi:MAG: hypothetical protein B7X03_01125 [Parcubacteria group bacterium 21-58-10]|nr:MAG: hypothetical protein B7X03_01125 [Parcubacteria group bacterium 21-58-10]